MKFHTLLLAILAAAAVPLPAAAQQAPDAGRGLDLARRWCAACHVVERGGAGADGTVGFPAVADDRSTTRERITTFLAAPHGGEGRRLIQLLGPLLVHEGFDWVVSTVTQELQLMLARLGLAPLVLGPARADALGDQTQYWGSYYSHAPVVLAIHLRSSLRQFLARRAPARAGEAA